MGAKLGDNVVGN